MTSRQIWLITVLTVFIGVMSFVSGSLLADHSASPGSLNMLFIREDKFWNWDFENIHEPVDPNTSRDKVDWPVNMVFWGNANVDKVKNIYWGSAIFAGTMHAKLNDGDNWVWDNDKGTKSGTPCISYIIYHMRLYADGDDRLYNINWGYYVLGTTHKDVNECWPGAQHGWSEDAEEEFARIASDKNYIVYEDWANFYNYEIPRTEGRHVVFNNGYATAVYVP